MVVSVKRNGTFVHGTHSSVSREPGCLYDGKKSTFVFGPTRLVASGSHLL